MTNTETQESRLHGKKASKFLLYFRDEEGIFFKYFKTVFTLI